MSVPQCENEKKLSQEGAVFPGLKYSKCPVGPTFPLPTHSSCCRGSLWKQSTYLWSVSEYIIWVDDVFHQKWETFTCETPQRSQWKGGPRGKCLAFLPLNTSLLIDHAQLQV